VRVLVVGDINVDMEILLPHRDQVDLHSNPAPRLLGGGSAANTAAALGRLGVDCQFVGTVGDDAFGSFARTSLGEAGVDVALVESTAAAPTVTVITVVPRDGDRLIYVWPPSGGAHQEVDIEAAVGAAHDADWVHVSGICLRVSPAREALLATMTQAKALGIPVSLDLNLRLENWGWDDGFREVMESAVELCDIVMGSGTDEVAPLAGMADPLAAARHLAARHGTVVTRLGPNGSFACSVDGEVAASGFDVEVADTVGAGDAHNAGFIFSMLHTPDVGEALRWGNAVAALTISRPGARSTPTLAVVEELLGSAAAG
jgi:sugar/nucleoside kinase (ribokinase family)